VSGPDPQQLHRQVTAGRLGRAGSSRLAAARVAVDRTGQHLDTARSVLGAAWTGSTASAAARTLDGRSAALLAADAELGVAQQLLEGIARTQQDVARAADRLLLSWLATVAARALTDPVTTAGVTVAVARELHALRDHLDGELARTATAFDALAGGAVVAAPLRPAPGSDGLPPEGADPNEVARWWRALPHPQQEALQRSAPEELAALTGLPPVVLDRVNRTRLSRDLWRLAHPAGAPITGDAFTGGDLADMVALRGAVTVRGHAAQVASAALDTARSVAAGAGPVLLLRYSTQDDRGVVVAVGDPSTATDVAVTVPGTSSSVAQTRIEQAVALRAQMDAADPSGTHAAVQWVDYRAPTSLLDPEVARLGLATRAADHLVAEVAGWRAAAQQAGTAPAHVTAVGHSYGSTVVGLAGARGLAADDIVLLGSPGVTVDRASQLTPGVGHVWAARAEHDPVVQATAGSWFSPGATDGPYDRAFGARQFAADDPASLLGAHSTYYEPGSESLRNLGAIATGDLGQVTSARPDGLGEAAGDVLRHAAEAGRALGAGDPDAAAGAVRAGLGDLVGDAGDAVLGGLGWATSELRGLDRR
jgi:hypothetical protein